MGNPRAKVPDVFEGVGFRIDGLIHVSPREAVALLDRGARLIDVRRPNYINGKRFDVAAITYLPLSELKASWEDLPRDQPLILADNVGMTSREGVRFLLEKGFTNVANLIGGVLDWETAGLPTLVDDDEQLTGQCACKLKPKGQVRQAQKP